MKNNSKTDYKAQNEYNPKIFSIENNDDFGLKEEKFNCAHGTQNSFNISK